MTVSSLSYRFAMNYLSITREPVDAGGEIRTLINWFLRPAPLPELGYSGTMNPAGFEPANLLLRTQAL
jgi:hypothetical protein